jgi:DNA-directed RNA polymerase specialized sigma subunit
MNRVVECCLLGRKQQSVAQGLGVSQASISRDLKSALSKLKAR